MDEVRKEIIQIVEVNRMLEFSAVIPLGKERNKKLVELIKEEKGNSFDDVKYIIFNWDPICECGDILFLDKNYQEVEYLKPFDD